MRSASGRCPHSRARRLRSSRSRACADVPAMCSISRSAASAASVPSDSSRAPVRATSPSSRTRVVTSTNDEEPAGSSGWIWSESRASSSTTSTRRSARIDRNSVGTVGQLERHVVHADPEREQELGEHVGRVHRRVPRVEPAQARVQLTVRERGGDPVRPQHGQRGLADPGRPGEHADGGGLPRRQQRREPLQLVLAPGEPGRRPRQLGGHEHADPRRDHRVRRRFEQGVCRRAAPARAAQRSCGPGSMPSSLAARCANVWYASSARGPPARPVQREHQLRDQPLAERLRVDQLGQLADDLVVAAQLQLRVEARLQDREAQLGQLRRGHPAGEVGERRPTPQRVRVAAAARPAARPAARGPRRAAPARP